MTPAELAEAVRAAVRAAVDSGDLPLPVEAIPTEVKVERPKVKEHGDYATNIALRPGQAGRPCRRARSPRRSPTQLRGAGRDRERRRRRPGLPQHHPRRRRRRASSPHRSSTAGDAYGRSRRAGRAAASTWSSSRPTRPARCTSAAPGGPRWATRSARILRGQRRRRSPASTTSTTPARRSTGSRARLLAARARASRCPRTATAAPTSTTSPPQVRRRAARRAGRCRTTRRRRCSAREGVDLMFAEIKQSLHDFGVDFDVYFHENDLHESGAVERGARPAARAGPRLRGGRRGLAAHDRLRRRQGPGPDQGRRRADLLRRRLRLLPRQARARLRPGRDHARRRPPRVRRPAQGAVRGRSATTPTTNLEILIGQLVNLVKDGEPVRMSKRAGTVVTLDDLVDGGRRRRRAATPWRAPPPTRTIDLDLDLWTRQTNDNPVFYVQYAHARIAAVLRNAADLGHRPRRRADVRPDAARPRAGGRPAGGARRVPAGRRRPPPSCASRTGSRATWRSSPAPTTGSTTPAGCCRAATRRSPAHPGPAVAGEATRRCSQRPALLGARAHDTGAAVRPRAGPRPPQRSSTWLAAPAARPRRRRCTPRCSTKPVPPSARRLSALAPAIWPDGLRPRRTTARSASAVRRARPGRHARHAGVRPRRGRLPGARAGPGASAFAGADVYYAGKAFLCAAVARWVAEEGLGLDVCTGGELAVALRAGFPAEPDRLARQQQVRRRAASGRRRRRRAGSSSTRSTRSTGSPTSPRARRRGSGCWSG